MKCDVRNKPQGATEKEVWGYDGILSGIHLIGKIPCLLRGLIPQKLSRGLYPRYILSAFQAYNVTFRNFKVIS